MSALLDMELFRYLKQGQWWVALGYILFIGMMAAGYHYNITFVQIGLTDFGERLLGLSHTAVAAYMGALALLACLTALVFGSLMNRLGWGARFFIKLRVAFLVVLVQAILTFISPLIQSEPGFIAWILAAALTLGVGMPASFSLTVDLIPRRDRGYVAALITAGAYFAAEVFSSSWTFEAFQIQALFVLIPGVIGMGVLAFAPLPFLSRLARQHTLPEFARGRFVQETASGQFRVQRSLLGLLALMFGVFFVDSLGFLRLLDTPLYMETAWQSAQVNTRLVIGVTHVLAALVGGVLYTHLGARSLFLWIFGVFALTHMQYTFHIRTGSASSAPLSMPMLYAIAVSLYTVVNFAIWADLSTPKTIGLNTALGVALSGWTATFLSTAIAIAWQAAEMPLEHHLQIVDSLTILFFLAFAAILFFQKPQRAAARSDLPRHDPTSQQQ